MLMENHLEFPYDDPELDKKIASLESEFYHYESRAIVLEDTHNYPHTTESQDIKTEESHTDYWHQLVDSQHQSISHDTVEEEQIEPMGDSVSSPDNIEDTMIQVDLDEDTPLEHSALATAEQEIETLDNDTASLESIFVDFTNNTEDLHTTALVNEDLTLDGNIYINELQYEAPQNTLSIMESLAANQAKVEDEVQMDSSQNMPKEEFIFDLTQDSSPIESHVEEHTEDTPEKTNTIEPLVLNTEQSVDTSIEPLIDNFVSKREANLEEDKEESHDFTYWLQNISSVKTISTSSPEDHLEKKNLEENSLTDILANMVIPIKKDEELEAVIHDQYLQAQIEEKKSIRHRRLATDNSIGVISETIAILYAQQDNPSKAIEVYEKLILKFPEKSAFFVSQIDNLRK